MIKKNGNLKSKAIRSSVFKSVTFNVKKTLNDTHSVLIQLNSDHFFPGDTVNGFVYMNFSDNLPSESIDLIIIGYEETNFTLMMQTDLKEQEGRNKIFYKKVFLLKSDKEIKAGEYNFPFQFLLPNDIPASITFQDHFCSASIRYEIVLTIISKNKEFMEDIISKKLLQIYEKKKNSAVPKLSDIKQETVSDSKLIKCGTEELLKGDYNTILLENESFYLNSKIEYFEYPISFKSFCCSKEKSLVLIFLFQQISMSIGEPFSLINKIRGYISLDFINYKLYREIKCISSTQKCYNEKKIIEEQEVNSFQQIDNNDISIKVNFLFKGQPETKISRMPSCHGKLVQCLYFIFISVKLKGFCGQFENYKIPIHVSGEFNPISKEPVDIENLCLGDDLKKVSYSMKTIVLK